MSDEWKFSTCGNCDFLCETPLGGECRFDPPHGRAEGGPIYTEMSLPNWDGEVIEYPWACSHWKLSEDE